MDFFEQKMLVSKGVIEAIDTKSHTYTVLLSDNNPSTDGVRIYPILLRETYHIATGQTSGSYPVKGDYCVTICCYHEVIRGNSRIPVIDSSYIIGFFSPSDFLGNKGGAGNEGNVQPGAWQLNKGFTNMTVDKDGDMTFRNMAFKKEWSPSRGIDHTMSLRKATHTANMDEIHEMHNPAEMEPNSDVHYTKILYRKHIPLEDKNYNTDKLKFEPKNNEDLIEWRVGNIPEETAFETIRKKEFDDTFVYKILEDSLDKTNSVLYNKKIKQEDLATSAEKIAEEIIHYTFDSENIRSYTLTKEELISISNILTDKKSENIIEFTDGVKRTETIDNENSLYTFRFENSDAFVNLDIDHAGGTLKLDVNNNGSITMDMDGNITIKGETIKIGTTDNEPLVKGTALQSLYDTLITQLNAHIHPTGTGPSGPATNAPFKAWDDAILSDKHTVGT